MEQPTSLLPNITISDDLKRRFKAKCALENVTMTDVIIEAITQYVQEEE